MSNLGNSIDRPRRGRSHRCDWVSAIRLLIIGHHLTANESARWAVVDCMLLTDEERDQAVRRVFFDCLADALATKTILVFQAHGNSFPRETEQDGRLQSVPLLFSFPSASPPATWCGAAQIYEWTVATYLQTERVCLRASVHDQLLPVSLPRRIQIHAVFLGKMRESPFSRRHTRRQG